MNQFAAMCKRYHAAGRGRSRYDAIMPGGDQGARGAPTPIDRAFQLGYRAAYRIMRVYWQVRRPTTHGALIALWHGGEVLLVRNSYVSYYSAPGGYLRRGEAPAAGAARELREEVGVETAPEQLVLALDVTHDWEGKRDHVRIFHHDVSERPQLRIDHREVVDAAWFTPERALRLDVFPPLKRVIAERAAARAR
jgi:8-oxo-dGTP diphosphatase